MPGDGDTPGTDTAPAAPSEVAPAPSPAAALIAEGLGDRREASRIPLREECAVLFHAHVFDATIRDVSPGGALLHGVVGVLVGDQIGLRLARAPARVLHGRVRGISLLGLHVAIEGAEDQRAWREAIGDLLA